MKLSYTLCLVIGLHGCGFGTEIGNGVKDEGTGDGASKKVSSANTTSSPDASEAGEKLPASAAVAGDLRMLYTSCASPLAELAHKSVILTTADATLKADWVEADGNAPAHWQLKDAQDVVLATVELQPPQPANAYNVMVFGADHAPLADKYTCGTAGERTVPLLLDGNPYATLSWAFAADEPEKLDRIEAAGQTFKPQE